MRKLGSTLCALLAAASAGAAPPPWLEVKSAHFTVVTNSGEKAGRRTAWQFEQIHSALVHLWPWARIDSGRPFFVFAVRDEATLKTLGPEYWEGKRYRPISFGASGRERQFIALRTDIVEPDEIGSNPYQSAYWSYVSTVFNRSFPRPLPVWYSRGIAEVMSNTIVRDKELHVGRPIRGNLELLQRALIPLNEFLTADHRSHWLRQESDAQLFDAQAWALVHYLLFGEKGVHAARVNRFSQLLHGGASDEAALKEAFGDMTPYHDGMRGYVRRELFVYMRVPVSLDTRPEAYATRTLAAGEAAVLCGEFLVAMGRPAEARVFAAAAAKAYAGLPGPWEIEAELLDTGEDHEPAKAAYQKAVEAGSKHARVYYRLAQLDWAPSPDKAGLERRAALLEKARELDPGRADTLSFLADVRVDLEQREEALALAQKAVELEPGNSYHHLALARVLWSMGRREEAAVAARTALQAAGSEDERRRAQQFLDFAGGRRQ